MALTITLNKGKRRAIEVPTDSSPPVSGSEPPHPTKRAKKTVETRQCPICDERIPLRLLGRHAELESERVEGIIQKVGSFEVVYDDLDKPGPSSRARRSAIKARKSIITHNALNSIDHSNKTIQIVKRNRKQRQTRLKELLKDDDESNAKDTWLQRFTGEVITCPVCSVTVRGDRDVVDAHVDTCLAHENQTMEEARLLELQRRVEEEETWEDEGNYVGSVRGAGFYTRFEEEGVEEDIDIDGDDQAIFGAAQFTEKDVVPIHAQISDAVDEDVEVEIEDSDGENQEATLRHLVAAGKVVKRDIQVDINDTVKKQMNEVMGVSEIDKLDLAIVSARQRGDRIALVLALESKVKQLEYATVSSSTTLLCRICIDPYTEPTVSTGCWHTCCRECWLRCLGSTKLCPICKRITSATDLRRVYL
ncbi:hypothetical protein BDN70DRAFT_991605 [Pholiota conissans]|uniref:RING-type domain-containing protein n=1 Tax=Pholiota conissans TaxID=109636 RepID=A0A9P6CVL0_9AGAR|nr:hypothetical protein BDN70DRAFT_991605 [Pholiota conissans]